MSPSVSHTSLINLNKTIRRGLILFHKAQACRIVNGADSDAERMTVVVSKDFSKTKSFPSHSWLESFDGHSCISSLYLAELKINICR